MSISDPLPDVRLHGVNYTASHYCYRLTEVDGTPRFDLAAPYQRGSVWDLDRKRNLIKSLMLGVPIGSMVISVLPYAEGRPTYRVVDGKQRIETLQEFYHDGFTVPGWWFEPSCFHDPSVRDTWVDASALNRRGMNRVFEGPLPVLEFHADVEWTENPDFDSSRPRNNDDNKLYLTRKRSDDEILQAEAELYLLINFGGVAQTDDDKARASMIAEA